jgi:N-acetylglucosaminyldiphosphoundecaprenol N-acetyl-beta-D-mannosaminyltransferase
LDIPQIDVLGTKVAAIDLKTATGIIVEWLNSGERRRYVCVTDVHCIMQGSRRRDVRDAYTNAALCVPDGMPLTWLGHLRGYRTMNRVYGPDLMLSLLGLSPTMGFTHFFLGGAEGVADNLAARMKERFPGLEVVGTYCPPWRPLTESERNELIGMIKGVKPDLVWVGLGAPKQDLFMAEFHGQLDTKVMIGVGAAFDFHTGRVRQAPRWMMKSGLEWLFRLCVEPRRLGPRYLRNNPAFLWHIFLQQTGLRKYPVD